MKYSLLASPMKIGDVEIKNRTVMTAMGVAMADISGMATDRIIKYYEERAKGGVGLIIPEFTKVSNMGPGTLFQLSLTTDDHIGPMSKLVDVVHKYGTKIFIQLHHAGRQTYSMLINGEQVVSPSAIPCGICQQDTRALEINEIKEIIGEFINAAWRAKAAGADGVEVHAGHGYLLNQFLSPNTNKRDDEYGGSIENRCRIVCEIIQGIKEKCGGKFPISVRITTDEFLEYIDKAGQGINLEMSVQICKLLEKSGADALNVTCGTYETITTFMEPTSFPEGWRLYLAETIKKSVNIPVFGNTVIRNPKYAEEILENGSVDFIAMGRSYLADPHWTKKALEGRDSEIRKCISCLRCVDTFNASPITQKPLECSVNPILAKEGDYSMEFDTDGENRCVAIVGGGPAGLEAARILAMRNFKPIIFESSDELGGQLCYAKKPPKKERINWLIEYYNNVLSRLGVEIRLNTKATLENIKELSPYAVIIATGSKPIVPQSIAGINGDNVYSVTDILSGKKVLTNKNVCVIGSGMTGIETTEMLAEQGNKVSVVEMADSIAPGAFFMNVIDIMSRVNNYDVNLLLEHKLLEVKKDFIVVENAKGERIDLATDAVVLSLGVVSEKKLFEDTKFNFNKVYNIGDSDKIGRIGDAVSAGFKVGYNL
ncbi:MAG: FAD-dependent oxidoreductase [Clostridium sp.]